MSFQPLATERLDLRNWQEGDRSLFHRINSDDRVMEFFPFRRDRTQSDALMDRLAAMIERTGYGFLAIEIRDLGRCAGFAGLAKVDIPSAFPPGTVEIGWRLAPQFWGKGYVTEAASALLRHGFVTEGLAEIVSFAVPANHRSVAVMQRLGMRRDPSRDFDMPNIPDKFAALRPHIVYALTAREWRANQQKGAAERPPLNDR